MNNIDKSKELVKKLKIEKEKWTNRIYGVGETRVDLMIDEVTDTITKLLAIVENNRMAFEKQTENLSEAEIKRSNTKDELDTYKNLVDKLETKLMFALSPTDHELSLNTKSNFKRIIRENLESDTYTIRKELKKYWNDTLNYWKRKEVKKNEI